MRRITECFLVLLAIGPIWAQRGYPQIEMVYPGAVSRGKTSEVLVAGHYNFREPMRVLFEGRRMRSVGRGRAVAVSA